MGDEFRWPEEPSAGLRDGLTTQQVIEALYAPTSLRLDNRTPTDAPTFLAVCAPTAGLRLIVVVCPVPVPPSRGRLSVPVRRVPRWRKHTS